MSSWCSSGPCRLIYLCIILWITCSHCAQTRTALARANKREQLARAYDDAIAIPGWKFLGVGLDLRYDLFEAARPRLVNFTWSKVATKKNLYEYVSKNEVLKSAWGCSSKQYKIPDEISVRTIDRINEVNKTFNKLSEFQKSKTDGFDKSASILFGLIKFSIKMRFAESVFSSSDTGLFEYYYNAELFEVSLDVSKVKVPSAMKADMDAAVLYPFDVIPDAYIQFLEKYGTHFCKSVVVGASATLQSSFQKNVAGQNTNFFFNVGVSFAGMLSVDVSVKTIQESKSNLTQSNNNIEVTGGVPTMANFVGLMIAQNATQIQNTITMIDKWRKSVPENPVPVPLGYKFEPISSLFKGFKAQAYVTQALACYYDTACYRSYLARSLTR